LGVLVLFFAGGTIAFVESMKKFKDNIKEYSPTLLFLVPAVLELVYKKIYSGIKKSGKRKKRHQNLPTNQLFNTTWQVLMGFLKTNGVLYVKRHKKRYDRYWPYLYKFWNPAIFVCWIKMLNESFGLPHI